LGLLIAWRLKLLAKVQAAALRVTKRVAIWIAAGKNRWVAETGNSDGDPGSPLVRILGCFCFLAALSVVVWVPAGCTGSKKNACPSYSFNEPVILKFERGGLTLVAVLFIAAILWYTVVKGEMPTTFGISGASATYVAAQTVRDTEAIRLKLRELEQAISDASKISGEFDQKVANQLAELERKVR
jgi:hypothetical protein